MDFFDVINKRRSVRKYVSGKKLSKREVDKILKTVNLAPSAGNLQSFKVAVVQDESEIAEVNRACFNQKSGFIAESALILIFCANPAESAEKYGRRGERLYAIQDATIAATYAQLAVAALGYSACWVGAFDTEYMKRVLKTDLLPVAVIVVGFGAEQPERPDRKSLDELAI